MDDQTEALARLKEEFKFDKMIVIGVTDASEQLHFITSGDLMDVETMLILLDAMADLTAASYHSEVIH